MAHITHWTVSAINHDLILLLANGTHSNQSAQLYRTVQCYHFSVVYDGGAENTELLQLFTYRMWCKLTIFGQWLLYVPPGTAFIQNISPFRVMLRTNGVYTMRYEVKLNNVIHLTRFWESHSGVPAVSGQFSSKITATWRRGLIIGVSIRRLWVCSRASACDGHIYSGIAPEYIGFPVAISV